MQAAPEDRISERENAQGFPLRSLLLAAGIVVLVAVLYLTLGEDSPPAPEPVPTPAPQPVRESPTPQPVVAVTPNIPVQVVEPELVAEVAPQAPAPEQPPLTLENSDEALRDALSEASATPLLLGVLETDNLLQRSTGVIDGLNRGVLLRKILPLPALAKPFAVRNEAGRQLMDPAGFERYNSYANAIAELDTGSLVSNFHRFRPLFESAYAELGLPREEFDNAVIRALDRILSTPELTGPVVLERKSVMFTYADPALEGLAPLQKQLLRMGPANLRQVKAQAGALREGLLQQP
jgi:hypothetical protein